MRQQLENGECIRSRRDGQRLARVSGYGIYVYVVSLPLLGYLGCVGLSIVYDFEKATATHCHVRNYLPSISAAISFTPQRYIWRLCIALHSSARVLLAFMMYNYHRKQNIISRRGIYMGLVNMGLLIHLTELGALLMLSMVSSSENYPVHETSFIVFMVCSLVYMLFTCIIMRWAQAATSKSPMAAKAYRWKCAFFIANLSSFMCAIYFFYRHNNYCEPGVYTLFAFMEYITVTTNILFHGSASLLLKDGDLSFTLPSTDEKDH